MTTPDTVSGSSEGNAGLGEAAKTDAVASKHIDSFLESHPEDATNTIILPAEEAAEKTTTPSESAKADIPEGNEKELEQSDIPVVPQHWPAERKAIFDKLPEDAKKAVIEQSKELERAFVQKTENLANQRKMAESVESVLKPFESDISEMGLSKAEAVGRLATLYNSVKTDPVNTALWILKRHGIDPATVLTQQEPTNEEWVDPTVVELRKQLEQTQQILGPIQEERAHNAAKGFVQRMSQMKDDAGNPAFPYYNEDFGVTMAEIVHQTPALLQMPQEQRFKVAYDLAVARNHSSLMDQEVQQRLVAEDTAKALAARSVKPRNGATGSTIKKAVSDEQTILDNFAKFGLF